MVDNSNLSTRHSRDNHVPNRTLGVSLLQVRNWTATPRTASPKGECNPYRDMDSFETFVNLHTRNDNKGLPTADQELHMQTATERCTGDLQRHGFFRNLRESSHPQRQQRAADCGPRASHADSDREATGDEQPKVLRHCDRRRTAEGASAREVLRHCDRRRTAEGAPAREAVLWHCDRRRTAEGAPAREAVLRHCDRRRTAEGASAREVLRHARCSGTRCASAQETQGRATTTGRDHGRLRSGGTRHSGV